MSEKKDIWEKISDAAASAGKAIGDEYQKLKLSHDISTLRKEMKDVFAEIGERIYRRHTTRYGQVDEEFKEFCLKLDRLKREIKKMERQRDSIGTERKPGTTTESEVISKDATAEAAGTSETQAGTAKDKEDSALEFMEDVEIQGFCQHCGGKVDPVGGRMPSRCPRCGGQLPT